MDQSAGQALESPASRNCQGEPGQGQAGGYRVKPAAGCAPCALFSAPTARGKTCEKPGSDQSRPELWKDQPTAEFSMSLLEGDPQPLHSFCTCSSSSKTFNFSNNICSVCFPQFNDNFTSFEKFETGIFQKNLLSLRRFLFPPKRAHLATTHALCYKIPQPSKPSPVRESGKRGGSGHK